jgi:hypothetical protein
MKPSILLLSVAVAASVAGCAHPDYLRAGMTSAQLDARFGTPAAVRHDPDGDVRIYSSAPLGQRASAAHLDANGTVFRVEPVLNTEHFATIVVGRWNKNDVLTHFGRPAEDSRIPGYEVWSFRYRENEQWDSMFHVMFDAAGIVRQTQNGPDPMYEIRRDGHE